MQGSSGGPPFHPTDGGGAAAAAAQGSDSWRRDDQHAGIYLPPSAGEDGGAAAAGGGGQRQKEKEEKDPPRFPQDEGAAGWLTGTIRLIVVFGAYLFLAPTFETYLNLTVEPLLRLAVKLGLGASAALADATINIISLLLPPAIWSILQPPPPPPPPKGGDGEEGGKKASVARPSASRFVRQLLATSQFVALVVLRATTFPKAVPFELFVYGWPVHWILVGGVLTYLFYQWTWEPATDVLQQQFMTVAFYFLSAWCCTAQFRLPAEKIWRWQACVVCSIALSVWIYMFWPKPPRRGDAWPRRRVVLRPLSDDEGSDEEK